MRVLERVRQDYVDGEKVTYEDLMRAAMKGMLNTLDPHSEFMEPTKYTELKNDTEGAFGGVGIVVGCGTICSRSFRQWKIRRRTAPES